MRRIVILAAGALAASSPTFAAEPKPQYSVADVLQDLAPENEQGTCPATSSPDATAPGDTSDHCRGFSIANGRTSAASLPHATNLHSPALAGPPPRNTPARAGAARLGSVAQRSGAGSPGIVAPAPRSRDLFITFANNSATLTEQAMANIRVFAQAIELPALKNHHFVIEGHTNAIGSRELNLGLSQSRAKAVADFIVSLGVDRSRLEVEGRGFDAPIDPASPKSPVNRRVEARRLD